MNRSSGTPCLSLADLARQLDRVGALTQGDASLCVTDVRQDSREVQSGDLFAARSGSRTSGAAFATDAVRRGAVAILAERGSELPALGVPVLWVDDIRLALALAAEAVHQRPSQSIGVVGITGTNGKTTTASLVRTALGGAEARAASLGTLGFELGEQIVDSSLTTPEADQISRYAARARDAGATHLVMEVSSHALSQARVDALTFAAAAFSNLTQDHLDYHATMEEYAASKARLFVELAPRVSVINVDDPFGARLAERVPGRVLRVSRHGKGDVRAVKSQTDARGIQATVVFPSAQVELQSRLVGEHNLDNLLLALGIVEGLGLDVRAAAEALHAAPPIPGRLERCDGPGDDILVLVDYAHTPDALRRALRAVRGLTDQAVICVFGCGGDRDPDKRPKMGQAVAEAATTAIVSNDNPRTEDPAAIARQIEPGLRAGGLPYEVELDRAAAIRRAVLGASPGDVVLIAGKGHEPYQIVGTERRAFDDRVEARRALAARRERVAS